jgi:hypothetical protein
MPADANPNMNRACCKEAGHLTDEWLIHVSAMADRIDW